MQLPVKVLPGIRRLDASAQSTKTGLVGVVKRLAADRVEAMGDELVPLYYTGK